MWVEYKAPKHQSWIHNLLVWTLMGDLAEMNIKHPNAGLVGAMQGRARETAGNFKFFQAENLLQFYAMGITPGTGLVEALPGHVGPQGSGQHDNSRPSGISQAH